MAATNGTTANGIPIDHLDYGYIEKTSDAAEIEKIVKSLRTGSEGYYPELIRFAEDKLRVLKPKSKLLIQDQSVKRGSDLPKEDREKMENDLHHWEDHMTRTDRQLSNHMSNDSDLPPVRNPSTINSEKKKQVTEETPQSNSPRIKSTDFASWDKFDVEKETTLTERDDEIKTPASAPSCNVPSVQLSAKEMSLSDSEKEACANREREKGNEAFRAGDYEEAVTYYSRSIEFSPTAAAYNNRALTCNKLGRYNEALTSCNEVLKIEPDNTKAMIRRANAYISLGQYCTAATDIGRVLELEPGNKRAQELQAKIKKDLNKTNDGTKAKKGKRVVIEEVEETEETEPMAEKAGSKGVESESKGVEPDSTDLSGDAKAEAKIVDATPPQPLQLPLPPNVQELKDKGNSLFRCGQYETAVQYYTNCIRHLEKVESDGHTQSLSTILSNRAACHFKNGDCRSCIDDATRSIELSPINLKSFVRRGQAYEAMEKYKQAYYDYQLALRIDSRVDQAREAASRISRILRDSHGNNWRDHLPIDTDIEKRIAESLAPPTYHLTPSTTISADNVIGSSSQSPSSSLPSVIPVITSTATTGTETTVSQSTSAISSTDSNRSGDHSKEFNESKDQGNIHFKKGDFKAASSCYAHCIHLCPSEVAPYTNRALCFLKLNQFALAEDDCTNALELDPNNSKALYRRAIARKSLKKLNESLKDLRTLIKIDPDNSSAKKEEKIVYDLYHKELRELQATTAPPPVKLPKQSPKKSNKTKSATPTSPVTKQPVEKKRKKIIIEEVNDETEDQPKGAEPDTPTRTPESTVLSSAGKKLCNIEQQKLSTTQYIQLWNSLSISSSPYDYAVVLMKIPPSLLPQVITIKLEGHALTGIIAAVEQFILAEGFHQIAYDILLSLTKVSRFSTILMFLTEQDKQSLRKVFSVLENSSSLSANNDMTELKRSYSLK